MFAIRGTQKLLRLLDRHPSGDSLATTTRLGDWYGNVVEYRKIPVVLLVSERSLLPVLVPAQPLAPLLAALRGALAETLAAIGVDDAAASREVAEMASVRLARTENRRVLGSMTDFAFMISSGGELGRSLREEALWLAEAPCSPIAMKSPRTVAVELLQSGE